MSARVDSKVQISRAELYLSRAGSRPPVCPRPRATTGPLFRYQHPHSPRHSLQARQRTMSDAEASSSRTTGGKRSRHDTTSNLTTAVNRHNLTPLERQRVQLDKLLLNPDKEVILPSAPKSKHLRAARDMIKNVQGSSAGAGSGEFHVYKQSRRREYERLKIMEEVEQKKSDKEGFEKRQLERNSIADAKTSKNRAKRDRKKQLRKKGGKEASTSDLSHQINDKSDTSDSDDVNVGDDATTKKRKLVVPGGTSVVFKKVGEESNDDDRRDEVDEKVLDSEPTLQVQGQIQPAIENGMKVIFDE